MAKVLLVDDQALILNVLSTVLQMAGHEVQTAQDGESALKVIKDGGFELIISDIRMPPMDGIEVLRQIRAMQPAMPVILMTGYGTIKTAIDALKLDAFDYISKPIRVDEFLATVNKALAQGQQVETKDFKADEDVVNYALGHLVAASETMKGVCDMIRRVAAADIPVLIAGEFGVGRETIARTVHELSPRKDRQFPTLACAELPEPLLEAALFGNPDAGPDGGSGNAGLLAAAEGGTLFFEDVNLLPIGIQRRLEAFVLKPDQPKGRHVKGAANVRFVGCMTELPGAALSEQEPELFTHLNAVTIRIPPLRERREDILPLVAHILRAKVANGQPLPVIAPDAQDVLRHYQWPGNISELNKAIEHALANLDNGRITRKSIPVRITAATKTATPHDERPSGRHKALKEFLSRSLVNLKGKKPES